MNTSEAMTTRDAAALVRQARQRAALSQRELARRAGTSSATISLYEAGRKAPRIDTLDRLLGACGHHLELRAVPVSASLDRNATRSLALHRVIAERLHADPDAVLSAARRNLATMRAANADGSADHWLDNWAALLEGPVAAVVGVLTEPGEGAQELRQNTPFAGVLTPRERWAVYREYAA